MDDTLNVGSTPEVAPEEVTPETAPAEETTPEVVSEEAVFDNGAASVEDEATSEEEVA